MSLYHLNVLSAFKLQQVLRRTTAALHPETSIVALLRFLSSADYSAKRLFLRCQGYSWPFFAFANYPIYLKAHRPNGIYYVSTSNLTLRARNWRRSASPSQSESCLARPHRAAMGVSTLLEGHAQASMAGWGWLAKGATGRRCRLMVIHAATDSDRPSFCRQHNTTPQRQYVL